MQDFTLSYLLARQNISLLICYTSYDLSLGVYKSVPEIFVDNGYLSHSDSFAGATVPNPNV